MSQILKSIALLGALASTSACMYEPDIASGPVERVDVGGGHSTGGAGIVVSDANGFGPTMIIVETYDERGHPLGQYTATGRGSGDIVLSSIGAAAVGGWMNVIAARNTAPDINNNINNSSSNANSNSSSNAEIQFSQEQWTILNSCQPVTVGGQSWMIPDCGL